MDSIIHNGCEFGVLETSWNEERLGLLAFLTSNPEYLSEVFKEDYVNENDNT